MPPLLLTLTKTGSAEEQVMVNCEHVALLEPLPSGGTRVHFGGHRENYIEVVEAPQDVARRVQTVALLDEDEREEREAERAAARQRAMARG
jgi:hypothetical protein